MAWIIGINMDLNFNLLETGSLALSIILTAITLQVKLNFKNQILCKNYKTYRSISVMYTLTNSWLILQDGTSHYMKGLVLLLSYIVISVCFFVLKSPLSKNFFFFFSKKKKPNESCTWSIPLDLNCDNQSTYFILFFSCFFVCRWNCLGQRGADLSSTRNNETLNGIYIYIFINKINYHYCNFFLIAS